MRFTKHDSRKPRLDLVPSRALEVVGHVLRHGARTYAPRNWEKCTDPSRYVAALLRHANKHVGREFCDPDSGLPHLASAIASGLFALDLYLRGVEDWTVASNYFAIVERTGKTRGIVKKRFRSWVKAMEYFEDRELDIAKYTIKTVPESDKVGVSTALPRLKKAA